MGIIGQEIDEIKSKGVEISEKNLIISEAANLILPFIEKWMKLEKMLQVNQK